MTATWSFLINANKELTSRRLERGCWHSVDKLPYFRAQLTEEVGSLDL